MYHDLTRPTELTETSPLSEKLRPTALDDLTLNEKLKSRFNKMIEKGNVLNMLFYGRAGSGKTTVAKIIGSSNSHVYDSSYYDMSLSNSIEYLRENIIGSAINQSLYAKNRVIILDEADALNVASQNSLKITIEAVAEKCRFILITNNHEKIIEPIKSRLKLICFDPIPREKAELISDYTKKVIEKLKQIHPNLSQDEISEIKESINLNYPDYRAIANDIEFTIY